MSIAAAVAGPEAIIAKITTTPTAFDPSTDQPVALKKANDQAKRKGRF